MNFVSLFAGVGGFDLAFEDAGMTCIGQVEIDDKASSVLAEHWPDVPRWKDIHDISGVDFHDVIDRGGLAVGSVPDAERSGTGEWGVDVRRNQGGGQHGPNEGTVSTVDVLVGGFPCQDYSVAGFRGGLAGDRGAVWWEFHRLIAELRPTWVVGENVLGLMSSNGGRDFGTIVGSLVELGYGVVWAVLDAQYFGVAQRRRRVFIVGHSGGQPRPEILALGEGVSGHPAPSREAGKGVAVGVAGRPDLSSATSVTLGALTGGSRTTDLDGMGAYVVAFAQNTRDEVRDLGDLAGALAAQPGMKQTTYLAIDPERRTDALTVRRLTPLECERLQGFPDNWTASQSDTQRYRQMGNAVAVPVARWIGQRIVEAT